MFPPLPCLAKDVSEDGNEEIHIEDANHLFIVMKGHGIKGH